MKANANKTYEVIKNAGINACAIPTTFHKLSDAVEFADKKASEYNSLSLEDEMMIDFTGKTARYEVIRVQGDDERLVYETERFYNK